MPAYHNMPIQRQLLAIEDRLRRMHYSRFATSGADMASFATAVVAAARMLTVPVDHPSRFDHLPRMTMLDGSVWYAHVPGDPPPVSGELRINVLTRGVLADATAAGRFPAVHARGCSDDFDWGMMARQPDNAIVGWRLVNASPHGATTDTPAILSYDEVVDSSELHRFVSSFSFGGNVQGQSVVGDLRGEPEPNDISF